MKWSEKESTDLNDYNKQEKIIANFSKIAVIGKNEICFTSEKEGLYYGVLLYKLKNSNFGIGTWIKLKVDKPNFIGITGKTINSTNEKLNIAHLILLFLFLILLLILILLLKKIFKVGKYIV